MKGSSLGNLQIGATSQVSGAWGEGVLDHTEAGSLGAEGPCTHKAEHGT